MNKNTQHHEAALAAIENLRSAAVRGDTEAAEHLLNIGNRAAGYLEALATHPKKTPGRVAIDTAAARAVYWPVECPAIEELRFSHIQSIPKTLGNALPFRVSKGATKHRDVFDGSPTFAMGAFRDMEEIRAKSRPCDKVALEEIWHLLPATMKQDWRNLSILLPPLSKSPKNIAAWKEAGTRWADDQCQGQWKSFPWPTEVMNRAKQPPNSGKSGIETAVKEMLGKGFATIARLPPIVGD